MRLIELLQVTIWLKTKFSSFYRISSSSAPSSSSSSSSRPNTYSQDFCYSSWKSSFMRQHHIETNWRLRAVRPPRVLKGHDDHVITCLQFDGERARIVSGSDDNTLKVREDDLCQSFVSFLGSNAFVLLFRFGPP